jgi:hypothetical protein
LTVAGSGGQRDDDVDRGQGASAPEPRLARRIASSGDADQETASRVVRTDPEAGEPYSVDRVDAGAATLGRDERGQFPEGADIEGGDDVIGDEAGLPD